MPVFSGLMSRDQREGWIDRIFQRAPLEHDLAGKLNHPWGRVESQEIAVGAGRGRRHAQDLAESRIAQNVVREIEVRVVEQIECLHPDR